MMYANGKGTPQSYEKAGDWWSKAAEGGHMPAASNLSLLYRGGSAFPPNRELSEKWSKVAEQASASAR
jgi:uncharacterized protein